MKPQKTAIRSRMKPYLLLLLSLWVAPAWAVPVTLATIQKSTWTHTVSVMGQVKSVGMVTLTAPMTGRVEGPFQPTGMIPAGAVIAFINPPGLQARLQAAQAQVEYTKIALQRNQRLLKDGVVAQAAVDTSSVTYQQALDSAHALQAERADQSLTAPFAGNIHYLIAPGAVVTAGSPIAKLSGRAQPWVEALVPPPTAYQLRKGTPAVLRGDYWQGSGEIRSVGSSARQSGLVSVVIRLPEHTPVLPGEWLSVKLQTAAKQAVTVPVAAVVMHGARAIVYLDIRGHAHPVSVRVLGTGQGVAHVVGDLKAGEQVVLSGNTRLSPQSILEVRQ